MLMASGWVQPLLLWLVFMASALGVMALLAPSEAEVITRKRLKEVRARPVPPDRAEAEDLARPFRERVVEPLLSSLVAGIEKWTPRGLTVRLEQKLVEAGRPVGTGTLLALKLAGVPVGLALATLLGGGSPAAAIALGVGLVGLAFFLPDLWVARRITERRRALSRALPDVLDLLSVSVEAGLGFDGAVQKVSEKFPAPTSTEFRQYLKELRLGKSREEALRGLAERAGLPEFRSFAAAVIQADRLGVSLARVLRVQSEQLRHRRKQRAEEQAMKTPIKMLLPLVLFIFPTLFIVLLGPAVLQIIAAFSD